MKPINAFAISLAIAYAVGPAIAQTAKPPAPATPAAPPSAKVDLSATDLQVALIAISNAGAACDIGVKQFCQLVGARDATVAKLQGALDGLSAKK